MVHPDQRKPITTYANQSESKILISKASSNNGHLTVLPAAEEVPCTHPQTDTT